MKGLKLPPPVIYAIAIFLGLVLNYFFPNTFLPNVWRFSVGMALMVISGVIASSVVIRYKKSKTTFDVRKTATVLITDGFNRYSRNPGYVALTLLYLGIGFVLNNVWVLGLTMPLLLIMDLWIIRKEEHNLKEIFGEEYLQYKSRVRRWI